MKAIIWSKYGGPEFLTLEDVEKPTPKDNEVLIKVHSATVTAGDCEIRSLSFAPFFRLAFRILFGFFKPRNVILGQELSGVIESIGKDVTSFKIGDPVFATTGLKFGAYAEYICLKEKRSEGVLLTIPNNMDLEAAACVPFGGLEALHFIRQAQLKKGQSLLIIGAGGSIGSKAIQIAKDIGAEITAIDSKEKLSFLKTVGADHVIDYKEENFAKSGLKYDVIFDVVGKNRLKDCLNSLTEYGHYVLSNPKLSSMFKYKRANNRSHQTVYAGTTVQKNEDLLYLKTLIEAGKLTSYIDKSYPLKDITAAHQYVEAGHKKGNLVLRVSE